jgi:hypothetical protein
MIPWSYTLFNSVTHWDNSLRVYQKYQNLMVDGFYDIKTLTDGYHSDVIIDSA